MKSAATDLDRARSFINRNLDARQNVAVVHGFPSVLMWTAENVPVADVMAQRERRGPASIDLYVGVPYCPKTKPDKCGYCLFPVEDYTGQAELDTYFEYLKREGTIAKPHFERDVLMNVFFGGGTSNLYRADRYPALMDMVRDVFPVVPADIDVTLEGLPALFTQEKMRKIKEAGMTRISMGAQQMNDELNQLSGRKQSARHVIQSVEWARELGLGCNVDLIFGWPRQTVATMVKDLEMLIGTGVEDITHYELHIGGPTDFALNRRHELPSTRLNLELYRTSRDLLLSRGFKQISAYNWRRSNSDSKFAEGVAVGFDKTREGWGWGYAGASFFALSDPPETGWMWKNATSVARYRAAIDAGQWPIERGYKCEPVDLRLSHLFRALHGMVVNRAAYRAAFGVDVVEEYSAIWQALAEVGFVEVDEANIRLVGDGVFYTPTIQALLGEARSSELKTAMFLNKKKLVTIGHILGSS